MIRRAVASILVAAITLVGSDTAQADVLRPPEGRKIRVAIVLTENAVVIDYAGPWEVFSNVHLGRGSMDSEMPFELYTVGRDRNPIHTAAAMKPGMTVVPDFGFADAPDPDVVVVGAQTGDEHLSPWLQKLHRQHALIMSVCTGVYKLAEAGILDGKPATTHHDSLQRLANQYPHIAVKGSVRYVQSDPFTLTAGGLSSGIDSALHVVDLYYGRSVAQATADDMEYQGEGWKTNLGNGQPREIQPTIPLAYQARATSWQGTFLPAYPNRMPELPLVLHLAEVDGAYRATIDVPSDDVFGQPVDDVQLKGGHLQFKLVSAIGVLEFAGTMSADRIAGHIKNGQAETPLALTKSPH